MNPVIVCIVEGDGEVRAIPVLLRRLAAANEIYNLEIPPPIRVHRDKFLMRQEEFERKLRLAAAKARGGTVMVILDADDDCPVQLARNIETRARSIIQNASLAVVIPNREYEAWLIAAADSLAGNRGLSKQINSPTRPDEIRDAKGWLSERIVGGRYHEVSDQPAMTALFDIETAQNRSRSFRKIVKCFNQATKDK